jgi:quercetin dioxygenase-like cupin family protein
VVVRGEAVESERLDLTDERRDGRRVAADLRLGEYRVDPHTLSIEESLRAEADDVYGWSNGPGDRYARHAHGYTKILHCLSGSIDFVLDDRVIGLRAGERIELPAGTAHAAVVGPNGCACIEGKARG